jgi:1-acyl-sn-glycerol-3-phosphate acyltransferase
MFFMMMNLAKNRLFRIEYIYQPGFYWTDQEVIRMVSLFSAALLRLMGVIISTGKNPGRLKSGYLIVSNHLSYIDVLILSKLFPGCFVTSVEILQTPFLGHITTLAGCVFVERRTRRFHGRETREIRTALNNGLSVIVFPEGTSSNGDMVLRFRQPLFQAAVDSGKDIVPVCITYEATNHIPVTPMNRDMVFWYGDMTFFDPFAGLSQIYHIRVRVTLSPPLPVTVRNNPAALSEKAHKIVKAPYLRSTRP